MSVVRITTADMLRVANTLLSGPQLMLQLEGLLRNSATDLDDVASRVKRDPALTARLIRMANSAAFAEVEPVASVEDAVALIGFREVHRIIGLAMLEKFGDENLPAYGITSLEFRENSLFTALLMEELAVSANANPRTCYTLGLLRSIGKACLDRMARNHPMEAIPCLTDGLGLSDWEEMVFGLSSNSAAATMLSAWRFPADFVAAIGGHYGPESRHEPLTHLLSLAASMADALGHGLRGEACYWLEPKDIYHNAGLEPKEASAIIDQALESFHKLVLTF
jgi:HD-like signal output (HDOD) protein